MTVAPPMELVTASHAPLDIICQLQARVLLVQSSATNASTPPRLVSLVQMDIIRVLLEFAPLVRQTAGHAVQHQIQTVSLALTDISKPPEMLAQPVQIQIV